MEGLQTYVAQRVEGTPTKMEHLVSKEIVDVIPNRSFRMMAANMRDSSLTETRA